VSVRSAADCWAGIDVGGRRKGFHVAALARDPSTLYVVAGPARLATPNAVIDWLRTWSPRLVGVDAPRRLADDRTRFDGERRLAREVCHLRYTPTRAVLERQRHGSAPTYYEWIEHGLELYAALDAAGLTAIEAFPTAAWTRWTGPRNGRPRGAWSAAALRRMAVRGVARLLGQDERDAIGAALMARECEAGRCEHFGDIVVPRAGRSLTRS
jgi:predicted nuclease with RNAse H fold